MIIEIMVCICGLPMDQVSAHGYGACPNCDVPHAIETPFDARFKMEWIILEREIYGGEE